MSLAACGADGNTNSTAACDAWVDVDRAFGVDEDIDAAIAALDDFVAAAPSDIADRFEPFMTQLRDDPESALESDELAVAETAGDNYALDNCADTRVDVEAINFAYVGVPSHIDAGRVVFNLVNHTQTGEFHEALLLRKNAGTTESAHDLLAAGLADPITVDNTYQALAPFTISGAGFVEPDGGDTSDVFTVDLDPGDYILACLLPLDSPELLEGYFNGDQIDAQRHFSEGMFAEFTVG